MASDITAGVFALIGVIVGGATNYVATTRVETQRARREANAATATAIQRVVVDVEKTLAEMHRGHVEGDRAALPRLDATVAALLTDLIGLTGRITDPVLDRSCRTLCDSLVELSRRTNDAEFVSMLHEWRHQFAPVLRDLNRSCQPPPPWRPWPRRDSPGADATLD